MSNLAYPAPQIVSALLTRLPKLSALLREFPKVAPLVRQIRPDAARSVANMGQGDAE
jgi:hypothetical protein